jgi:choline dehydrogenase-like flavoprotein
VAGADNLIVVIGSGPPGAAAAVSLSRAGFEVLVLEAGLEAGADGITLRVKGVTLAKKKGTLKQREGVWRTGDPEAQLFEELAPGGLSNHWSCAVPRFSPQDFADAERAGVEARWPVGYADLEPWYEQVEPWLHIAGPEHGCAQLPAPKTLHTSRLADDWSVVRDLAPGQGRSLLPMPYAYAARGGRRLP